MRTRLILLGWNVRLVAMAIVYGSEIRAAQGTHRRAASQPAAHWTTKIGVCFQPYGVQRQGAYIRPPLEPNQRRVIGMCELWNQILTRLEHEIPEQQVNTWLRPLQAVREERSLRLLAPNRFAVDWVQSNAASRISALLRDAQHEQLSLVVEIGSRSAPQAAAVEPVRNTGKRPVSETPQQIGAKLNPDSTFERFVEGKSNHFAKAAAMQVAENPGKAYNPLFIYGGTGLGKTHLMQAVGHVIRQRDPQARVAYVHSERFVDNMVQALRHNTMNEFKTNYRSLSALLIDDIQFFANKTQSQEEFFHTFNTLFEGQCADHPDFGPVPEGNPGS